LLEESRNARILALEQFPAIVKALQEGAAQAVRAIEAAKRLVIGSAHPPATESTLTDLARDLLKK
jgi:hypothetical protein